MGSQTVIVNEVDVKGYKLSVTTRDAGDDPKHLEEITYRTIVVWLMIADKLEQGDYTLAGGSVEQEYVAFLNKQVDTDAPRTEPFELPDAWGAPRCTVWNTFRGKDDIKFHLHSDDVPQTAINTWLANHNAVKRAYDKFASVQQQVQNAAQQNVEPSNSIATPNDKPATPKAQNTPQNGAPAVEGAIVATRAPNPNERTYADGQLVEFKINKIVLGTHPNSGSVIYSLWGDLGKKYALKTVYVMASNGTDKSYDYQAAETVLSDLGLTIPGKMQAEGNWKLVCKAANAGEKQYMNIVSLY